ncbi:hypothetical protein T4D_3272 [Trichinella pseudospiralis]|uniref:Uncharacterized protein n=1 Tax=Trichinella pseudospiralis TaxID=6337 RepID=A0A0V1FQC4_TRIPS|nr:hypothetical protein T4D_3272 [Trichinella pseudospiralis]
MLFKQQQQIAESCVLLCVFPHLLTFESLRHKLSNFINPGLDVVAWEKSIIYEFKIDTLPSMFDMLYLLLLSLDRLTKNNKYGIKVGHYLDMFIDLEFMKRIINACANKLEHFQESRFSERNVDFEINPFFWLLCKIFEIMSEFYPSTCSNQTSSDMEFVLSLVGCERPCGHVMHNSPCTWRVCVYKCADVSVDVDISSTSPQATAAILDGQIERAKLLGR